MTTIVLPNVPLSGTRTLPRQVLVAGLARNLTRRMETTIQVLRRATESIDRVHFLVIESDSTDNTVQRLERLAAEVPNFRYISLGQLCPRLPDRTERIAHCRNFYLDELQCNPIYSDVSHLIVADLDGVCHHLTAHGLLNCWNQSEPWDVCTANQADYYYDIWALRHPTWNPHDCWQEYERLVPIVGKQSAREIAIVSRMIHIPSHRPMIEVESAFGGLGIYCRETLSQARYSGKDANGHRCCEHVPLNESIRSSGHRIFINPAMINANRTSHAGSKKFFRRFRRNLWTAIAGETWELPARKAA